MNSMDTTVCHKSHIHIGRLTNDQYDNDTCIVTKKIDMQTSLNGKVALPARRFMQICIRCWQKTSLLFEIMDGTETTGRSTMQSLK